MQLGRIGASVEDWDIVNLLFLNSSQDSEIVWLVCSYVLYVWETMHVKKLEVNPICPGPLGRDRFPGGFKVPGSVKSSLKHHLTMKFCIYPQDAFRTMY